MAARFHMTPGHVADRSRLRFSGIAKYPAFEGVEGRPHRAEMKAAAFADKDAGRTDRCFDEIGIAHGYLSPARAGTCTSECWNVT